MGSFGNTIIIILLVPIAVQVIMLAVNQRKRHKELLAKLESIKAKLE